jgi:hypothetical protein
MRHSKEKNNDRFNDRWPFLFYVVIDSFDLREIELTGHQFTWANSLPKPTFEKLDRVLMTTEWEFKLAKLLREEEIKFYDKAKVIDVLLGDNNTKYFQMVANGKHRKKRILSG